MNFKTTCLAAAALTALAGPALAGASEDAFASFRSICGDTAADFPGVVKAADAANWQPDTQEVTSMDGVVVSDKLSRKKKSGDAAMELTASHGVAAKFGNAGVSICTVVSNKAEFGSVVSQVQGWLGMAPHDAAPTKTGFHYTPNGTAFAAVPDGGFDAAAAGGGMMLLTVRNAGGKVTVDLIKLKK
ncbi:MAG TPA: hypothetical protein VF459_02750 [Caulobacteraceae bacterium]